jgi:hypothetical protein
VETSQEIKKNNNNKLQATMNRSFNQDEAKAFNSDWEKHQRRAKGGLAWIDWHFQNESNNQRQSRGGVAWVENIKH